MHDSDVCESVEFSLMAVLYNGAIGKFVMPSILHVIPTLYTTVEFSLMAVLYNGAIGKFVTLLLVPSILYLIHSYVQPLSSHAWLCCVMVLLVSF